MLPSKPVKHDYDGGDRCADPNAKDEHDQLGWIETCGHFSVSGLSFNATPTPPNSAPTPIPKF